jgi:hypothetical protein
MTENRGIPTGCVEFSAWEVFTDRTTDALVFIDSSVGAGRLEPIKEDFGWSVRRGCGVCGCHSSGTATGLDILGGGAEIWGGGRLGEGGVPLLSLLVGFALLDKEIFPHVVRGSEIPVVFEGSGFGAR